MQDEYGHISGYGLHGDKRDKRKRTRSAIRQYALKQQLEFEEELEEDEDED